MTQDITLIEISDITFDVEAILKKLHTHPRSMAKTTTILEKLAEEAQPLARPRGGAIMSSLTPKEGNQIEVDGVLVTSDFVKEKLADMQRGFPYLATEGLEMSEWSDSYSGTEKIFANILQQSAVQQAKEKLEQAILDKYDMAQVSALNPGSLRLWPITQQTPLFQILEPLPQQLGITLLPSYMMKPEHSVSGIFFQTDTKFHNCQLCPMEDCPGRKVPSMVM